MKKKDALISGFALFAMFFGAGNLIFPPFLGRNSGEDWVLGFLCFIIVDIGLALLAIIVIAKIGKGAHSLTEPLGRKLSLIILSINTICLGPVIAIPRTAATSFEFSIEPFFPNISPLLFAVIFFIIVILFCLKQNSVIDIIGAVLAPLMLVALLLLIAKGIVSPLGSVVENTGTISVVIKEGITSGYQTMDLLGAVILSVAVVFSIVSKGYVTAKQQTSLLIPASLVCGISLFLVYGGLTYLGATASTLSTDVTSQSALLISITNGLLGQSGVMLLGWIVIFACLTTAIGLISSCATFFTTLSDGKLPYKTLVVVFSILSCGVSTLGITAIINFAGPILDLLYPALVVLTILGAFRDKITNLNVYRLASLGAFLVSVLSVIEKTSGMDLFVSRLPFYSYGFPWVVPAALMGLLGFFISDAHGGIFVHKNTKTL